MQITGKLYKVFQTQKIKDTFQKREFVLEIADNPQYPQYVVFEFTQDNCSLLDGYQEGEQVDIQFNLRGREWRNPQGEIKFFNTLGAWKISRLGNTPSQTIAPGSWAEQAPTTGGGAVPFETNDDNGDLPF
ncbi:MAG: DUF3127 domain-containing protein [Sphingobacteriia bacterium]|nr:DUF3127 domain-containing protein [Sphingobacteriia bacterium]